MKVSVQSQRMLLAGMLLTSASIAWGQTKQHQAVSADVAVTFAVEHSQFAAGQSFWFKGGGADAAMPFWKGFGAAASFSGDHTVQATSGIDVDKITWLFGPRYTLLLRGTRSNAAAKNHWQFFAQSLFGKVHGFNGIYPDNGGATSSANSFALQLGGGANLDITRNVRLRVADISYVRNQLPNAASNTQNNLRVAFGICFHLPSRH